MKRYILIILILFSIVSCDDKVSDNGTNGEDGSWLSFLINMSEQKSMGEEFGGTQKEQKLNSARIVFYSNDYVADRFDYKLVTDFGGNKISGTGVNSSNGIGNFKTEPVLLKKKDYQILVIINPNDAIKSATEKNQPYSNLVSAATVSSVNDITGESNDNFLMTNIYGLVDCPESKFYLKKEQALNDPLQVWVERAAAKVHLKSAITNDILITDGGVSYTLLASTIQWTLDVTNKKLFWLRKPTFRKGGRDNHKDDLNMEQPTDYLTKDPENNNISNRAYLYAEDPNFSVGFSSLSALQLADEFQYLYYLSDDKIVWKNVSEDLYVTENTMETKEVFENVVTQMVIRVGYSTASKPFDGSQFFYYYVPIRHFTDTLTEQEVEITNDDDVNPGGSEEGEGGFVGGEGKDKKWGSCAVVRNNVYVLNLKSIQRLGINSISLPPKENIPLE